MKTLQTVLKKFDHGCSEFSTVVELIVGAFLILLAIRWLAL